MASTIDESVVATSAYEVNDSYFEVSDVEGDMTEDERAIKRKEKIKKKMNERVEMKGFIWCLIHMRLQLLTVAFLSLPFQWANLLILMERIMPVGAKTCKCIYMNLTHIFGWLCV